MWACKLRILFLSDSGPDVWKLCPRPFQALYAQAHDQTKGPWRHKTQDPGEACRFMSPELLGIKLVVTTHSQILGIEFVQSNHSDRVNYQFKTPLSHLSIAACCFSGVCLCLQAQSGEINAPQANDGLKFSGASVPVTAFFYFRRVICSNCRTYQYPVSSHQTPAAGSRFEKCLLGFKYPEWFAAALHQSDNVSQSQDLCEFLVQTIPHPGTV